ESALRRGTRIVCLPEVYRSPYFPQFEHRDASCYAETIPGESTEAFAALARQYHSVIIVPLFERAASGEYYNSAVVIDTDGSLLPVYHKVHIPHDPLFYEKHYFRPGEDYRIYETELVRFAVLICYDQWFPEAARAVTLMGAEVIFYPTAIGWICDELPSEGDWREAWETVQRGHAIANGTPVAAANRVGREGDLLFWGSSFVCDAFGNVIARAGEDEEILIADLDLAINQRVREGWGFLRNRCPSTYGVLQEMPDRSRESHTGEQTPRQRGYRMPAEWERHDAVWLSWPHEGETFSDLEGVERSYVDIVRAVSGGERVELLVADDAMRERAGRLLAGAGILQ
ncbi:MAG TPA: nitrilase-related carbon-nitrogen hydrolase, partial [Methanomicrobiales archaeon]|nr:nitrilase-related carbon-nitrogen hydrolase [Methanomicrobiales archaeon]